MAKSRGLGLLAFLVSLVLLALPSLASAEVPVGVRVIKGSRSGPAKLDPQLEDLKRQLSPLAYVKWEQVSAKTLDLVRGKTEFFELPGGDTLGVTLQEAHASGFTLEVALTQRNTQTRLTVEKGQRIVHQVLPEKNGEALFVVLMGWP